MIALNNPLINEPIKRSRLRNFFGKKYFQLHRYKRWLFTNTDFASCKRVSELSYSVFKHQSPLIRKLKNVDMFLQYNKITNLRLAINRLNGIIIKPGQTFSYWKLIGAPAYRKGYLDGLVLKPDGSFGKGVGGGLCQLANLIYWMALHTPLTITERHRHSYDIFPDDNRTQPFGSGATCVYNYMDLQIYNGTASEYQLKVHLTEDYLIGEWLTNYPHVNKYEVYEKEHYISSTYWGAYIRNNSLYRNVFDNNGLLLYEQFITENHAFMMYQPLLPEPCKRIGET